MRTAEEILNSNWKEINDNQNNPLMLSIAEIDGLEAMINEARKEAIESAAEQIIPDGNPLSAKEKILSLIKKLK